MTLRFRLNLLITLLFIVVFFSAGVYIVSNARAAVREEIGSSAHFALQLVELVLAGAGSDADTQREIQRDIIGKFSRLESTRHRLGLLGMRERVAAQNGDFTLESAPGAGVRIRIRLPLEPGRPEDHA